MSVTAIRDSYRRLIFINRPDKNVLRNKSKLVRAKEENILVGNKRKYSTTSGKQIQHYKNVTCK